MNTVTKRAHAETVFEWPSVAYVIVATTAMAVLVLQAQDSLSIYGMRIKPDNLRGRFLDTVRWAALPLFGLVAYQVAQHGWQGVYVALFSMTMALTLVFNFRSDYIRPGTFDLFEDSRWHWMTPMAAGLLAGVACGLVRYSRDAHAQAIRRPGRYWIWPILLAVAACRAYFEAHNHPTTSWSTFANTRHYAVFILAALFASILVAAEWWRVRTQ